MQPGEPLQPAAEKLKEVLVSDTELGITYAIKEPIRDLLKTTDIDEFQRCCAVLERSIKASKTREARSLFRTLKMWRTELLVFCRTRLTNARSEAANVGEPGNAVGYCAKTSQDSRANRHATKSQG